MQNLPFSAKGIPALRCTSAGMTDVEYDYRHLMIYELRKGGRAG
jgi:hypothetical protein